MVVGVKPYMDFSITGYNCSCFLVLDGEANERAAEKKES